MIPNILIIDDDRQIRHLLATFFKRHDFQVIQAENAKKAKDLLNEIAIDIIILDWMMPHMSGIDFLNELRQQHNTRVIMLTAKGDIDNRLEGLQAGADDYLAKPFEPEELLLRVRAVLRRGPQQHETRDNQQSITLIMGDKVYDTATGRLRDGDKMINLTSNERALMDLLTHYCDKPCSRHAIAQACDISGDERAVDVQINRLRRKIEANNRSPQYLVTERGKGYMLKPDSILSSY